MFGQVESHIFFFNYINKLLSSSIIKVIRQIKKSIEVFTYLVYSKQENPDSMNMHFIINIQNVTSRLYFLVSHGLHLHAETISFMTQ